jgi:hypothetical protein
MRDYLSIGSVPAGEDCVQVGTKDYCERAKKECRAFAGQLLRRFGEPPTGVSFAVKGFPHDFGTYYEVVVYFDDKIKAAIEYAFRVENNMPEYWDETAKKELAKAPAGKKVERAPGMPEKCDICHGQLENLYYDAKTKEGPWANMCDSCWTVHRAYSALGTGQGQKYDLRTGKKLEG